MGNIPRVIFIATLGPELAAVIEATKTSDLAFIVKSNGAPLDKEAFVPEVLFSGWLPGPRTWIAQSWRNKGGEQWRDGRSARSNIRLEWRPDGLALYAFSRPREARP